MSTPTPLVVTNNFRIHVEDGTTQAELLEVLTKHFPNSGIAVIPDTSVAEITEEDVLKVPIVASFHLEQRARAIQLVKQKFVMPSVAYARVSNIITDNLTDIVFGPED